MTDKEQKKEERKKKMFLPLILGLVIWLLGTLIVVQVTGVSTGEEVLYSQQQPRPVNYHAGDPYELSIVRLKQSLSSEIVLIVNPVDDPGKQTVMAYPYPDIAKEEDWTDFNVEWYAEGIRITFTKNGPQLFIPAHLFTLKP